MTLKAQIAFAFIVMGIIGLSGCFGDAFVVVNYKVKNKTNKPFTIYCKNSSFCQIPYTTPCKERIDTAIVISAYSEAIINQYRTICGFANCRYKIENDVFFDSLKLDPPESYYAKGSIIRKCEWKFKRHSALLLIKKRKKGILNL